MTTVEQQRLERRDAVDAADAADWNRTLTNAVLNTMPPRVCPGQQATFAARDAEAYELAREISLSPSSGARRVPRPH